MKSSILFLFCIIFAINSPICAQTLADYRSIIETHEGNRSIMYKDSMGNPTVGIGHLIIGRAKSSYSNNEINNFFIQDLNIAINSTKELYPIFPNLPLNIRVRLVDFMFNIGITRAKTFKKFNAAINSGQYSIASKELINSRYYLQVKGRAAQFGKLLASN